MDLISVLPSASKSCVSLHKPLSSSTHKLKPFCRTIRILGMPRRWKFASTGRYHSNLWNDDVIQFMSTPYGWEDFLDSYMQDAKWIATGYLPTFEEYLENGKVSSGHRVAALQPMLTMDIPFPPHILKEVDLPSNLTDLAGTILRLRGDTRCYQEDRARGEEASCISCYMKDNPGATEEDALNHLNVMISGVIKELNWELLKPESSVPISSKKINFDITRAFHYGYKYRDGYSVSSVETKNLVMRTLLESVPL